VVVSPDFIKLSRHGPAYGGSLKHGLFDAVDGDDATSRRKRLLHDLGDRVACSLVIASAVAALVLVADYAATMPFFH
jgi:hypothetical protein